MKVKVTIKVIHERKTGTCAATGRSWCVQPMVIGWYEPVTADGQTREQLMLVKVKDDDLVRFDELGLQAGSEVEANLSFSTYVRYDHVFNDIVMSLA